MVLWVTGLSGTGKTSLCSALYQLLKPRLPQLVVLDGDVVRSAFGNDLSYSETERIEQVKRLQRIAKILSDQALVVMVAVVYCHPDLLEWNRQNLQPYFEVYLRASIETVRKSDVKGLYARAGQAETANVVGMDIPWHAPASPDLVFDMDDPKPPASLARQVAAAVPWLARALPER